MLHINIPPTILLRRLRDKDLHRNSSVPGRQDPPATLQSGPRETADAHRGIFIRTNQSGHTGLLDDHPGHSIFLL